MTFRTGYTYTLRNKTVSETSSVPNGTLEEFKNRINAILKYHGEKPDFKFSASFG